MTASAKTRLFDLAVSRRVADAIVADLADVVDRIEVAGSIRRQCPRVHDIDIVAIPKTVPGGLFGDRPETPLFDRLRDREREGRIRLGKFGDKIVEFTALRSGIPVEIYIADADSWTTILFIRTGSATHNIMMMNAAHEMGWKFHADGSGFEGRYDDYHRYPETEDQIFELCGLPYRAPENRR
jgi:DNA polymerase/3'-5' exonuclease PolX